jgi:hypothetical protein
MPFFNSVYKRKLCIGRKIIEGAFAPLAPQRMLTLLKGKAFVCFLHSFHINGGMVEL